MISIDICSPGFLGEMELNELMFTIKMSWHKIRYRANYELRDCEQELRVPRDPVESENSNSGTNKSNVTKMKVLTA